MAVGTFKIFKKAKKYLGNGTITLGAGVYKFSLHRASASATLAALAVSTFASVPAEISARGGYAAGGRNIGPATGIWTTGASAGQYKFSYTTAGIVYTASGSALNNIKYLVARNSTGAGAGKVLCFCTLSSSAFTISSPNTLTITPNASGVFTMA